MQPKALITGWSHGNFGKQNADIEELIGQVCNVALADAKVAAKDIDAIFIGNYGGGFSRQGFPASLVFQSNDALRFTPATRVENACATGTAAIYQGLTSIQAGLAKNVLVVGVETMTNVPRETIASELLAASYVKEEADIDGGFAGVFGILATDYFQRHGDRSESLARIAEKNHANGARNPHAQLRKELDFDFCNTVSKDNPQVAGPLRRTDCSPVSDGAVALVLTASEHANNNHKAVGFRSAQQVSEYLPMSKRDALLFEGCELGWKKALSESGTSLDDLSFVETHDCFTIAELLEYEAMGLTPRGEGHRAIDEGWTRRDGKLPVNVSGGLKAKGHPIGATGVSMHVMAAMQLTGEAGDMQLDKPELAGVFNMGGVAVANYVSILERIY